METPARLATSFMVAIASPAVAQVRGTCFVLRELYLKSVFRLYAAFLSKSLSQLLYIGNSPDVKHLHAISAAWTTLTPASNEGHLFGGTTALNSQSMLS